MDEELRSVVAEMRAALRVFGEAVSEMQEAMRLARKPSYKELKAEIDYAAACGEALAQAKGKDALAYQHELELKKLDAEAFETKMGMVMGLAPMLGDLLPLLGNPALAQALKRVSGSSGPGSSGPGSSGPGSSGQV